VAGGVLGCVYLISHHALRSRAVAQPLPSAGDGERDRKAAGWFSNEYARIAAGGPMPYALAIVSGVAAIIAGELSQCLPALFCSF
jgi:hypothetical protein